MKPLVIVLLLSGCSTQWSYVRDVGPSSNSIKICLPEKHRAEMAKAVEAWAIALRGWARVEVAHEDEYCSYTVTEVNDDRCQTKDALACTDKLAGRQVYMRKGRYEWDAGGILLHELGHAFGAQHLEGTLMRATYNSHYDCPDIETVIQVAAYQHADLKLFSWCYR